MRLLQTMKHSIKRIYHRHEQWEEIKFNMWGTVDDRYKFLEKAIKFTGDDVLYGSYMKKVSKEWKLSCEHNLTDLSQNRRAWIGHAACALAFKCPEDIVRQAWHELSDEQRLKANNQADLAIAEWENKHLWKGKEDAQKEFRF